MKRTTLIPVVCFAALAISCNEITAPVADPAESSRREMLAVGTIVVRVHWDNQGLPGKRVELLEHHRVLTTDDEGYAEFDVWPGNYTVRAYEINRGGPAMLYVDTKVTVGRHQEIQVEIVDCLPCV